jgi:hypothetical protein
LSKVKSGLARGSTFRVKKNQVASIKEEEFCRFYEKGNSETPSKRLRFASDFLFPHPASSNLHPVTRARFHKHTSLNLLIYNGFKSGSPQNEAAML